MPLPQREAAFFIFEGDCFGKNIVYFTNTKDHVGVGAHDDPKGFWASMDQNP